MDETDPAFAARQVDFLVKSHVFRFEAPLPLPRDMPEDPARIARYVVEEYGRWGGFASYEDTCGYRILSKDQTRPLPEALVPVPILQAMHRVGLEDSHSNRRVLYDELRKCTLLFSFHFPTRERELERHGAFKLSDDTSVAFVVHDWNGKPCLFAYTDLAYRVEPPGGCTGFPAAEAYSFMCGNHPDRGLVLNPTGPVTCMLSPVELKELAPEA